jgi:hypothetical protein
MVLWSLFQLLGRCARYSRRQMAERMEQLMGLFKMCTSIKNIKSLFTREKNNKATFFSKLKFHDNNFSKRWRQLICARLIVCWTIYRKFYNFYYNLYYFSTSSNITSQIHYWALRNAAMKLNPLTVYAWEINWSLYRTRSIFYNPIIFKLIGQLCELCRQIHKTFVCPCENVIVG